MEIRPSVFSGSWYPAEAKACTQEIKQFLARATDQELTSQSWLAGIVPHAGWYFSGEIACNVINLLKDKEPIDVVVLFGMHLHAGSSNVMMPEGAWQTPFGELPVAADLAAALLQRFAFQKETARQFNQDNTIELQLPFIKYLLAPQQILGLGVPPVPRSLEIGRAVVDWAVKNKKRIRIVGSTDLTHYGHNYGFSPKGGGQQALDWVRSDNDRRVISAMLDMAPERILQEGVEHQNACCSGAAATAVEAAKHLGATKSRSVAYATSYDKSPGSSFVGYTGIVFGA
jgi:AmmeMemoRadiSam system protein B